MIVSDVVNVLVVSVLVVSVLVVRLLLEIVPVAVILTTLIMLLKGSWRSLNILTYCGITCKMLMAWLSTKFIVSLVMFKATLDVVSVLVVTVSLVIVPDAVRFVKPLILWLFIATLVATDNDVSFNVIFA